MDEKEENIFCKFCLTDVPGIHITVLSIRLGDFRHEQQSELLFCPWCNNYGTTLDGKKEWFRDGYFD